MPIIYITPDEIVDLVNNKAMNISEVKSFSANANTFRVVLKIDKVPLDIKLNIQFDSFLQGKAYFNYSGTIPGMFVSMLKNVVSQKTKGNVEINNKQIIVSANKLIAEKIKEIEIKHLKFENATYRVDLKLS